MQVNRKYRHQNTNKTYQSVLGRSLSIDLSATSETFVLETVCQDQIYRSTVHLVRSEYSTILCEIYVEMFEKGWQGQRLGRDERTVLAPPYSA